MISIRTVVALIVILTSPMLASAQQTSSIAGVVRDTSGAVLPGVQVEASSPALIERTRSVVTDVQGRYNIVDLRPGTYDVTFTLSGFRTVRRERIELSSGFTASVNADLEVGALEETVTVTGASPLVDVQSTRNQTRVDEELLTVLPSGNKGMTALLTLTPGVTGASDVGGSLGVYRSMGAPQFVTFHGRTGMKLNYDGMDILYGNLTGFVINSQNVEEMALESSGVTAESSSSGFSSNAIPKEGSNRFAFTSSFLYTGEHLNSDNLSDELRARGLTSVEKVLNQRDTGAVFSGPILQNRLWFLAAVRDSDSRNTKAGVFHNLTPGTPRYTPDPNNPAFLHEQFFSVSGRLTYQASQRNKFNFFHESQNTCRCPREGFYSPEAATGHEWGPLSLTQMTWSSPVTNRLLLQGGFGGTNAQFATWGPPETPPTDIEILELSTGFIYNGLGAYNVNFPADHWSQRFSATYVTGTHSFKAGIVTEQFRHGGYNRQGTKIGFQGEEYGIVSYRFRDGVPNGLTQSAAVVGSQSYTNVNTTGLFAQDQWVFDRLTLNYGLRFDYHYGYVPAQSAPAGPYVPAREFAPVKDIPKWTDLSPRLGGVFDVRGDGRTAIKGYVGRFVGQEATGITGANNPFSTSVNTTTRSWNDSLYPVGDSRRGNFVPDCDLTNSQINGECGAYANQNFGRANPNATQYDPALLRGFGVRPASWDITTELQQQIGSGVSLTGGYYHSWQVNFQATDNILVTPADYTSYCVTAPVDSRLPDGGGYQVCNLADVSRVQFGRVLNRVTHASNFGKQSYKSDFFALNFRARLGGGNQLGGGIDTGRTVQDTCFVIDSPQALLNCRVVNGPASQTQVKLFGSYIAPAEIQLSATFQNYPGAEYLAQYNASNNEIAPSLGRNLASCGVALTGCSQVAVVPLIAPKTEFERRRSQLDFRVSRTFSLGGRGRLQANVDVYNVLNDGSLLSPNATWGPEWRLPSTGTITPSGSGVLVGRLVQFSGALTF